MVIWAKGLRERASVPSRLCAEPSLQSGDNKMTGLQVGSTARRPGKLAELLRAHGSGVGFRPHGDVRKRSMIVIGSIASSDADALAASVGAGTDALELRVATAHDVKGLGELVQRAGVPVGADVTGADDEAVLASLAIEQGVDWIRLTLAAPISALNWDRPARIVTVPFDLDLLAARGFGGLNVDAIVVNQEASARTEYTLQDAMRLRALSDIVRVPLALLAGNGIKANDVAACEQAGVNALVVPVDSVRDVPRLSALIAALEQHASTSR